MPEAGRRHVLDVALLAVGQSDFSFLLADARALEAFRARLFLAFAGRMPQRGQGGLGSRIQMQG